MGGTSVVNEWNTLISSCAYVATHRRNGRRTVGRVQVVHSCRTRYMSMRLPFLAAIGSLSPCRNGLSLCCRHTTEIIIFIYFYFFLIFITIFLNYYYYIYYYYIYYYFYYFYYYCIYYYYFFLFFFFYFFLFFLFIYLFFYFLFFFIYLFFFSYFNCQTSAASLRLLRLPESRTWSCGWPCRPW